MKLSEHFMLGSVRKVFKQKGKPLNRLPKRTWQDSNPQPTE
jgi:hypothetical protein